MSSVAVAQSQSARKISVTRIGVTAALAIAIAVYFWVDSRYPALLKKLHKGKSIQVAGALSFDALLPIKPAMPLSTRIGYTTVNWMYTNRVGMSSLLPVLILLLDVYNR